MTLSENETTIGVALKGFSWNMAGNFIRSLAGFAINIILARLLGPEPFGVVAIALLVISIGNLIIESGLGSALIQKQTVEPQDIAFVFTLQMAFGISLAILIVAIAPYIATQFSSPGAAPVLQVMALILVMQAFAQVPSALLRRELNFKHLQMAQITSFFVGYVGFGLPMAVAGFGVWSLVAAQMVQSGLNALMVYISSRHSLALTFKGSSSLALFGLRILVAFVANWIIQNVDNIIVGRRFGAINLGFYSRAYFLNWAPTGIIMGAAQMSLFTAVSRMGKGPETIRIFRGFMSAFAIFFFSTYWLVALESTNIIQLIYGTAWLPAAALLAPVAVAMPFFALMGLEGPVIIGLGKPQYEMWAQWLTAFIAIIVLMTAATISLTAIAWSLLIIYLFRLAIMSVVTIKILEISWIRLARPILSGLFMGMITIVFWNLANFWIVFQRTDLFASLTRSMVVIFSWILVFWFGHGWLFPDFKSSIDSLLIYKKNTTP